MREGLRVHQVLPEVLNILDLAWLCYSIAFLLEAFLAVESHDFLRLFKDSHEKEETADDGARASLAVVAVENGNSLRVLDQILRHLVADDEKRVKGRSLMVFPFVTSDILKDCLVDAPPADVYCDVFVLVALG